MREFRCRIERFPSRSLKLLVASAIALVSLSSAIAAAGRPHVVFILADDLGWGDPPCYNPD